MIRKFLACWRIYSLSRSVFCLAIITKEDIRVTTQTTRVWVAFSLAFVFWINPSNASLIDGTAVAGAGQTGQVGTLGTGAHAGQIEYFIPLGNAANGTYGVGSLCGGAGAGTCSDNGFGDLGHYNAADALVMNIFFDLSTAVLPIASATLHFFFDDLDLTPHNDPDDFFESLSLSYWQPTDPAGSFNPVPEVIRSPMFDETELPDSNIFADNNLIAWDLNIDALGDLNKSQSDSGGFWIQLGFGSLYTICDAPPPTVLTTSSGTTNDCDTLNPSNTAEYLTAKLKVSPIPIPATYWLFGTALLGFIGFSRRTSI